MKTALRPGLGVGLALILPQLLIGMTAQTASAAPSVQVQSALSSIGDTAQETNLGDVVADSVAQAGGTDVAIVAADDIMQTTIPAGSIDSVRIIKTLRYSQDPSDIVVVLRLTGTQLKQIAERSVSRIPQPFDGFLQISGMQITYSPGQPAGNRVTQLSVGGVPVQDAQSYRVSTTHSLGDGSFGYFRIWTSAAIADRTQTTVAAALTHYLAAHRTLNATPQHRIVP